MLIEQKVSDRPLSGLKAFSITIATHINDLPTTSPHGSHSDSTQKIHEFSWIRTKHVAQHRPSRSNLQPMDPITP
jgi:hypothetical protein